jgi:antitoxin component HigA of HigAB toxin-antitoxin module
MKGDVKPIRTKKDYEAALRDIERLWGAKSGTPEGDRLDVLATLVDAYEAVHFRRSCRRHAASIEGACWCVDKPELPKIPLKDVPKFLQ